ncbi:hypothetical protein P256_00710 [Acinetobacter nectaris CIP 110549]|uniref:Uncharacterized protein n=1 Tax=Acinetobacter nectaris CIP 110549 TaxID=1392540 RepID=V2TCC3_9GAMM|nr:hypothetical protein [Acinetobacter nectaris]ESK40263.1 hypothetical protein P256_00710 [Acinetobacter nectaris CIP 110549]
MTRNEVRLILVQQALEQRIINHDYIVRVLEPLVSYICDGVPQSQSPKKDE